jgi:ankyrin repeat protein
MAPIIDDDPVFHQAAYRGDVAQLALALEEINDVDNNECLEYCSPLHLAIEANQAEAVQMLLGAGADPQKIRSLQYGTSYQRVTAIDAAAYFGSKEALVTLADYGIKISDYALRLAAFNDHASCIQVILRRWKNDKRESRRVIEAVRGAFICAAPRLCQKAVNVLLKTVPRFPDSNSKADRNALTRAMLGMLAQFDESEGCQAVYPWNYNPRTRPILEKLIAAGAEVDSRAFWASTHPGETKLVRLLLDNGLDVNDRRNFDQFYAQDDPVESRPLILDVVNRADDDLSILEDFLAKGASASTTDGELNTPLHNVRHTSFVRLLLEHGADIDAKNQQGHTPLYAACESGRLEAAEELIAHGADVTAIISDTSWMHFTARVVNKNASAFGPPPPPPSRFRLPTLLLNHGANVDAASNDCNTLLHQAVQHLDLELLRYLAEHGADVHATTKEGGTMLHLLCFSCNNFQTANFAPIIALLDYIIDLGVDLNARDSNGATALHGAVRGHKSQGWSPDLFNALVQRGADINTRDASSQSRDGQSPAEMLDMSRWGFEDGVLRKVAVAPKPRTPSPHRGPPPGWSQGGSRVIRWGRGGKARSTWT